MLISNLSRLDGDSLVVEEGLEATVGTLQNLCEVYPEYLMIMNDR